jgi:hypothetical protein
MLISPPLDSEVTLKSSHSTQLVSSSFSPSFDLLNCQTDAITPKIPIVPTRPKRSNTPGQPTVNHDHSSSQETCHSLDNINPQSDTKQPESTQTPDVVQDDGGATTHETETGHISEFVPKLGHCCEGENPLKRCNDFEIETIDTKESLHHGSIPSIPARPLKRNTASTLENIISDYSQIDDNGDLNLKLDDGVIKETETDEIKHLQDLHHHTPELRSSISSVNNELVSTEMAPDIPARPPRPQKKSEEKLNSSFESLQHEKFNLSQLDSDSIDANADVNRSGTVAQIEKDKSTEIDIFETEPIADQSETVSQAENPDKSKSEEQVPIVPSRPQKTKKNVSEVEDQLDRSVSDVQSNSPDLHDIEAESGKREIHFDENKIHNAEDDETVSQEEPNLQTATEKAQDSDVGKKDVVLNDAVDDLTNVNISKSELADQVSVAEKITPELAIKENKSASSEPGKKVAKEADDSNSKTPVIPSRPRKKFMNENNNIDSENVKQKPSAPPPKPKKMSSKIAAFQQMFSNPEVPPTQKKAPLASPTSEISSRKLSTEKIKFAENLRNVVGRGIALPGMVDPNAGSPSKEDQNEPLANLAARITNNIRKAKKPKGRLPKSLQEPVAVEALPRFKLVLGQLWKHTFTKSTLDNEEEELIQESNSPTSQVNNDDMTPTSATDDMTPTSATDDMTPKSNTDDSAIASSTSKTVADEEIKTINIEKENTSVENGNKNLECGKGSQIREAENFSNDPVNAANEVLEPRVQSVKQDSQIDGELNDSTTNEKSIQLQGSKSLTEFDEELNTNSEKALTSSVSDSPSGQSDDSKVKNREMFVINSNPEELCKDEDEKEEENPKPA